MMRAMRKRRVLPAAALLAAAVACRKPAGNGRQMPGPIAIEFPGPAGAVAPELAPRLAAIGAGAFFVPVLSAEASGEGVAYEALPAPPPLPGRVYLAVRGRGDFDPPLRRDPKRLAEGLWRSLEPALRSSPSAAGVHLAWRVRGSTEGYAEILEALRRRLPSNVTLSAAVDSAIPAAERPRWRSVGRHADFLVAETFGRGADVDPDGFRYDASIDDLADAGAPVYAGVAPQGWGVVRAAEGAPLGTVSDAAVDGLARDRRFDFSFGDLLSDADEDVYVFSAKQSASVPRWTGSLPARGTVTFRERRVADLVRALSDAKAAPGKLIRLASLSDDGSLFSLTTLEDLLLGRELRPRIDFHASGTDREMTIAAVNAAPECSALSRLNNWIDVRVEGARLLDIRPGDFERFAFLDEHGRPVSIARARTIRLYADFVAPRGTATTGPLRFSAPAEIFAASHLTLPDGKVAASPEERLTPSR